MEYNESNRFTGDKIRSYRTKMKLTQGELAKKIGVKGNTISAYEKGIVELPHSRLLAIAEVFDISYLELLPITGKNETDSINDYVQEAKSKLDEDQLQFLEELIAKTISLDETDRKQFLKNIKFTVKFFDEN
jgi:transcriptional regulator with XRE-family HTH domain